MSALPHSINRMPDKTLDRLDPKQVIAVALNTVPFEWWKGMPNLSENSQAVHAVLDALSKAGWKLK